MKNTIKIIAVLLSFTLGFSQSSLISNQIIIKLKSEVKVNSNKLINNNQIGNLLIDKLNVKFNATIITKQQLGKYNDSFFYVLKFPENSNIIEIIEIYYASNQLEFAEQDYKGKGGGVRNVNTNDPYFQNQWGLKNAGNFNNSIIGADIDMENAWAISQGNSNVVVAVLDSGAKLDHPEFTGRIWNNITEISNNGIDDDSNGKIDDLQGWDFVNNDNLPVDDYGHGTNVMGIIGANGNNNIGYSGVDWNCKLMILKVLDNANFGYYSWWISAIYYAVDNGAKVINMSLGGTNNSVAMQNAINYATTNNVTIVASMMNFNNNVTYYPAGSIGVIAVGATNPNDRRANPFFWSSTSGSNFGNHISVVAPGNYIFGLNYLSNTDYTSYWGGTSQAAPLVSGLASLLISQNPNITPAQIKNLVENSAEDQVGNLTEDTLGWDQYYGHGRINAFNALINSQLNNQVVDLTSKQFFNVYPNPAANNFIVTFPTSTDEIKINNSLGQLITYKKIENLDSLNFELSQSGIYFITITINNEAFTKKIIIKN